jgi:transcriptional regulator with XRE-family HTH domain
MNHGGMRIASEGELGRVVRAERLRRDLDQRHVAELAGVGLSALRRLEAGQGSTLRTTFAVLDALDLRVAVPASSEVGPRRRAPGLPASPAGLTRREERTSWHLHRAVAAKLYTTKERERVLRTARANLALLRRNVRGPQAHAWLDRWQEALDGPVVDLMTLMLATTPEGVDMRQVSPFAGALSQDERLAAIRRAAA